MSLPHPCMNAATLPRMAVFVCSLRSPRADAPKSLKIRMLCKHGLLYMPIPHAETPLFIGIPERQARQNRTKTRQNRTFFFEKRDKIGCNRDKIGPNAERTQSGDRAEDKRCKSVGGKYLRCPHPLSPDNGFYG